MDKKHIIFAIIDNLKLDPNMTFQIFDWTITNNHSLINEKIPNQDTFKSSIGNINLIALFSKTVAFKTYELKTDLSKTNFLHIESNSLNAILSLIWFYIDNSIFSAIQFSQDIENHNVLINRRNTFTSNANGDYSHAYINKSMAWEFYAYNLYVKFQELFSSDLSTSAEIPITKTNIEPEYNLLSRIQRAFLILGIARTTSFLTMKIAFYINVLECLLLNDNQELSFRLKLFSAHFVGGDGDKKKYIQNVINTAYDVRSKFFHGSNDKRKLEQLQKISNQMDEIVRSCLLKAIELKDIFNAKNEVLDEYFKSIIFS